MIAASASIFVFGISLIVVLGISVSYTASLRQAIKPWFYWAFPILPNLHP
jgi:hypothetical protein